MFFFCTFATSLLIIILGFAAGVPMENILYLGGPNIASEIYNKEYANARICGSEKWRKPLAKFLRQPHFIVWDNGDLITHEVMGGLKNVYAIGAGKTVSQLWSKTWELNDMQWYVVDNVINPFRYIYVFVFLNVCNVDHLIVVLWAWCVYSGCTSHRLRRVKVESTMNYRNYKSEKYFLWSEQKVKMIWTVLVDNWDWST